ncbi:MAG: carboxy terminal-processing peptidase [Verrucomicrobiales bacterium]|nr:carboxy terminal-processing peptidase [Verrucomicrobiales bacterium]
MVPAKFLPSLLPTLVALLATTASPSLLAQEETQYGDLGLRVVGMLEEEHFLREPFNDKMSERSLDAYFEALDYSRIYFTKEDVDGFYAKYRTQIDDQVRAGGIPAAFEIFAVYEERVRVRVEMAKKLAVPNTFTYDSDRTVEISRKDSEWAKAGEEHDQLWKNLIEGDLLREKGIAEAVEKENAKKAEKAKAAGEEPKPKKDDTESKKSIYDKVSDRYDRILKRIKENTTEDVAALFIKSISAAYDPHSEYFSQQQYDNFRIGMNKSLTGIGAMLQKNEDEGGATIEGLVVGGPAFKVGKLEVSDRVIGVAQGADGEFVDAVEMKLSDIVDLIRGEIGTIVRLKVIPKGKEGEIKLVDILRDKIDLKDSLATADLIITKDPVGAEQKLGWITLPSFYADMDGGQTSTTTDVRRLLTRLAIEGINGLVIDLRDNGGGSLEEAINMTGLFIRKGPVVQSIDWRGQRDQKYSRNGEAVYGGPLIVLVNKASASASEIFAAALQDYGRAVIVGDESTFGKGTVQQLRPVLGRKLSLPFAREPEQDGALKLTIQTFYRIDGHSTQRHGVVPEVRLPSMLDIAEIGEGSLPNALVVDPIEPSRYLPFFEKPIDYETLQKASEARVASGRDFEYILKDINEEKDRIAKNVISLNLAKRNEETVRAEAEREARKKAQIEYFASVREDEKNLFTIYKLTQDNVLEEKLVLRDELSEEQLSGMSRGGAEKEDEDPEDKLLIYPHKFDPYERETIRILEDLIAIGKTGKPVNISEAKPEIREKTVPIEAKTANEAN